MESCERQQLGVSEPVTKRESFGRESKVSEKVSQCLAVGYGMARLRSGGYGITLRAGKLLRVQA
jgi:hypothetical protein